MRTNLLFRAFVSGNVHILTRAYLTYIRLLLLLYWYCINAFLANCRKGACGYVQCWKSSVLSSFLNIEKVILGSIKLEGRQFQAAGPA